MAFFEPILHNILKSKRTKYFENSAKCAYKPIFLIFHQKLNFAKIMSLTTLLYSADGVSSDLLLSLLRYA